MKLGKLILTTAFGLFLVVGCGNEKKEKEGFSYERKAETSTTSTTENDVTELVITGNDLMKYNKSELKAKAGKKVKLTLRHVGKADKMVMGHNVVILKQGTDVASFAGKAAMSKDNDYIPEGTTDVIAHTKMIGGGETAVVEFTAPEAGEYDFICSFPGHFGMMKGKFIVE